MLIPLDNRDNGRDFCINNPEWRDHPFTGASEMELGFPKMRPMLDLVGPSFGKCATAGEWQHYCSILGLLALRESAEPYCRRLLVLEVRSVNAPVLFSTIRCLTADKRATMVGTLMQICMARFEHEQPPQVVRWPATVPKHSDGMPIDLLVLGHVNFRHRKQWQPVGKRIRRASIIPPTHGDGIICNRFPLVGFADIWNAARIWD